ncbi:hypothetical protein Tco_0583604 [Tanacetum coccineum]
MDDMRAIFMPTGMVSFRDRSSRLGWQVSAGQLEAQVRNTHSISRRLMVIVAETKIAGDVALIAQSVVDALLMYEAIEASDKGNDSHDSGTLAEGQSAPTRECTYSDFLKCQPLNFKGTKGVIGLT